MTEEEKKRILAEEEALLKQEEDLLKQQELELRKTQELKDQARLERDRILEQQKTEKMEKAKKRKKKWKILYENILDRLRWRRFDIWRRKRNI